MSAIDINVDIGEGFPFDEELLDFATSANVCCGEHAGSWDLTEETVFLCRQKGVRIGMHPGFPDRESMGRARMLEDEVTQYAHSVLEQGMKFLRYVPEVAYIKPHGAFYNMLTERNPPNPALHRACRMILESLTIFVRTPVMLLSGVNLPGIAPADVIAEGFADRGYDGEGQLISRSEPGAILNDPRQISAQAIRLARRVESICIHGDTPGCVEAARLVYRDLDASGFEVGY